MATRSHTREYKKFLNIESEGSSDWVPEAIGYLVDLLSPEEQEVEPFRDIKLRDGEVLEDVPAPWRAIIMTEDGEEVPWKWPGYRDAKGKNALGIRIMPKGTKLGELFDEGTLWYFHRDSSNRAHVEPYEK